MAAAVKDGPFLAEFGTTDFQPEIKTGKLFFVSMGSGQMLANPFLAFVCRVLWDSKMPDVARQIWRVLGTCAYNQVGPRAGWPAHTLGNAAPGQRCVGSGRTRYTRICAVY